MCFGRSLAGMVLVVSGLSPILAACEPRKRNETAAPPAVVKVGVAESRRINDWDEFTGRVIAVEDVQVRARVGGFLTRIHFTDGQKVIAGDPLFTIDPRPYQATAAAAEAEVASAEAALEYARQQVTRSEQLRRSQAVAEQVIDERTAAVRQAEARLLSARAALQRARLDVEFTEVRAPVAGRVDRRNVSVGNLVSGGDTSATMLTNIVSLDPVHILFDVDQSAYLRYTRAAIQGTRPSSRDRANPVGVALPDEVGFPHRASVDFVSNQVDRGTATIRVRARLANPEGLFTPGLFVRVRLLGSGKYDAVLIPDEAVGTDQSRRVVYVVEDGQARSRAVELGPLFEGRRVVRAGLRAGETVVVSGLHRVRENGAVSIDGAAPAPGATQARN